MRTRMTSKMDVLDTRVGAVESTLKNHDASLKEHTTLLIGHSSSLNSLETHVAEMTKTMALMHTETRKGFQQQHRIEGGKESDDVESGASPGVSFVITREGERPEGSHQPKPINSPTEDLRLMAKRIELPPFRGEDPYGWIS